MNKNEKLLKLAKEKFQKCKKEYPNSKVVLRGKEVMVITESEILTIGSGFCMSEERVKKH